MLEPNGLSVLKKPFQEGFAAIVRYRRNKLGRTRNRSNRAFK